MAAGIRPGDVLVAIDGASGRDASTTCSARWSARRGPSRCPTQCSGWASSRCSTSRSPPFRAATRRCTSSAPPSASSRCWSARPCGLRRPNDPATLHFFWLCLAFFGTLTFSFSRLDRLDWYFYWADVVATLLLAPLFLHFTLVFPDRPGAWIRGRAAGSSRCFTSPRGAAVRRERHRRRPAFAQHAALFAGADAARSDRAAVSVGAS